MSHPFEDSEALQRRTYEVYQKHADAWDRRRRRLMEGRWLERVALSIPPPGPILDVGCGSGRPIAAYFIDRGYQVCGVDFAPAMLRIARKRWPEHRWQQLDMRTLQLDRTFGAVVAWNSFFHLNADEQRQALPKLAAHVASGGVLLMTIGDRAGEVVGTVEGDAVYHASLDPSAYRTILDTCGLSVVSIVLRDPECGDHSILLAVRSSDQT
ncbi:MAG: class I SAM-dependent methyltransferase [Myxococcota bacterium]